MGQAMEARAARASGEVRPGRTRAMSPSHQAFTILHWGFVLLPAAAGLDKFFHLLNPWDPYLAPSVARFSPLGVHGTMVAVGAFEVAAAVLIAVRPRIGAYVLAVWLGAIVVNLLMGHGYLDVALRDFGLVLGAVALGRLARAYDHPPVEANGGVTIGREPEVIRRSRSSIPSGPSRTSVPARTSAPSRASVPSRKTLPARFSPS